MNATLFSLVAVTLAFTALIVWVFWPSRRKKMESLGRIPFADDDLSDDLSEQNKKHGGDA